MVSELCVLHYVTWFCMIFYGFYIILYDVAWFPVCVSIILYDFIWFCMIFNDFIWFYIVFLRFCMVFKLFCMVWHDFAWSYMILIDFAWFCLIWIRSPPDRPTKPKTSPRNPIPKSHFSLLQPHWKLTHKINVVMNPLWAPISLTI